MDIDHIVDDKLKQQISTLTSKVLGVHIDELASDLTAKLTQSSLMGILIDTALPFKEAKKQFKRDYVRKLLQLNLGNISEVAKVTKTDRRSIHRLIAEFRIDVHQIKKDLLRPYDLNVSAVGHVIEGVLDQYKTVLHPEKLDALYKNVAGLSEDLVKELPQTPLSLKDAELEFEKEYLQKVLHTYNHNISLTAKTIGLRYETLYRKLKGLGLI